MRELCDIVWQRHGTSWIWDGNARNEVCQASEVWSLRRFLQAVDRWPQELPSNHGDTLVVAGLDGSLDLLEPTEAEMWLGNYIKPAILSFQSGYEGAAALVFWMPQAGSRYEFDLATDAVRWLCAVPHKGQKLDFGRILWGETSDYPQKILLPAGSGPAGLFHRRIT